MSEFWKDFDSVKELIKLVTESRVKFSWKKDDGCEINIDACPQMNVVPAPQMQMAAPIAMPQVSTASNSTASQVDIIPTQHEIQTTEEQSEKNAEKKDYSNANVVTSPLVGTFYSAASPEDEPFVKVGDKVKKGQKLGIIEAMKLMNDIESDFDGEIVEILVENEGVVEYGQPLFVIK